MNTTFQVSMFLAVGLSIVISEVMTIGDDDDDDPSRRRRLAASAVAATVA